MNRHPLESRHVTQGAGRRTWIALILLCVFAFPLGCAKTAYYDKTLPAQVETSGIDRVAVAEFDGLEKSGRMIAAKISECIVDAGHYTLLEREKLEQILAEREFSRSDEVDPSTVRELKLQGVDALIFGVVDVYSVDDQTGVTKVERKVGTGKYRVVEKEGKDGEVERVNEEITETILVDRGYTIRKGTVGVTFRMSDINTGEIVAVKTETAQFSEKAWDDEKGKLPAKDRILDDLSARVAARFVRQIQPQTVRMRVRFESHEGCKTGFKYAENGMWDLAVESFEEAAEVYPYEPKVLYNLAIGYNAVGRHEEAIAQVERAISIDPKDKYIGTLARFREDAEETHGTRAQ